MSKKRNLLYVFADQWQKTAVGFENDVVKTPTIDKFAKDNMIFDNAISTYPLCSPHRAALITGKYPYSLGIWSNCKIGLDEVIMLKPQEISIGNVLKDNGYQTAYIGKWHLDASENNFYKNPNSGAVDWDAYTPNGERRQGFDYWFSYGAMDNHLTPHYWQDDDQKIIEDDWSVKVETKKAIEYLENRDKNKPFCMFVSWNPPHPPYDKLPKYLLDRYDDIDKFRDNVPEELKKDTKFLKTIKEYYAAISGVDDCFKELMDYIKDSGLEDDTLIVLSADHGDMMGSQGLMGKNVWYEESIKIPLIIKDDKLGKGRSDVLFSSVDHMPTLLDLLDVKIPDTVQGKSLVSFVKGEDENEPETVFLSMIPGMPELIAPYRELGLNNKAFGWRGLRYKDSVYVVDNGCHPEEKQNRYYYDLKNDPYQLNPIILEKDNEICQKGDKILKQYLDLIKDPFLLNRI